MNNNLINLLVEQEKINKNQAEEKYNKFFSQIYSLIDEGNFEEANHIFKTNFNLNPEILYKTVLENRV